MVQRFSAKKVKLIRVTVALTAGGFKCVSTPINAIERELTYKVGKCNLHEHITIKKNELMQVFVSESCPAIFHYAYCFSHDVEKIEKTLINGVSSRFSELKQQMKNMDDAFQLGCYHTTVVEPTEITEEA